MQKSLTFLPTKCLKTGCVWKCFQAYFSQSIPFPRIFQRIVSRSSVATFEKTEKKGQPVIRLLASAGGWFRGTQGSPGRRRKQEKRERRTTCKHHILLAPSNFGARYHCRVGCNYLGYPSSTPRRNNYLDRVTTRSAITATRDGSRSARTTDSPSSWTPLSCNFRENWNISALFWFNNITPPLSTYSFDYRSTWLRFSKHPGARTKFVWEIDSLRLTYIIVVRLFYWIYRTIAERSFRWIE